MEGGWLISYIVLWAVTLLLVIVVLTHSRMLGLLHYRFGPANAKPLADGPDIGESLKRLTGIQPNREEWSLKFPTSGDLILIFISPQCSTCNEVLPHIRDFSQNRKDLRTVLVSTIDDIGMNKAYVNYRGLEKLEYIINEALSDDLNIQGVPYALYVDQSGTVRSKGLVNNYENLIGLTKSAQNFNVKREELFV